MKNPILVIGGGHQGLAMAAHLSLNGEDCFLWNRTKEHILKIIDTKEIHCSGVINGTAHIHMASCNLQDVLQKTILITTPAFSYPDIAGILAKFVDASFTIILNPGRTFGILEFEMELIANGCTSMPLIAETQTICYTCRREGENGVKIYMLKDNVLISTIHKQSLKKIFQILPYCLKEHFIPANSFVETSLGNVGMVLHCAPVLLNTGWIEHSHGNFKYYTEGITPAIAKILEKIDNERITVASALGYSIETLSEWLTRIYHTSGSTLYEKLQNTECYSDIIAPETLFHRYITEDVPTGLVPLESAGTYFKIETPAVSTVIDMANLLMDTDYRKSGRNYTSYFDLDSI